VGVCVCVGGFVMCGCVYLWVLVCVDVCMCGFSNLWMCVCVGVLALCVLAFTVFCIVSFMYVYFYLLLVYALLPPSENSIVVNNNNNNNNNNKLDTQGRRPSWPKLR